MIPYSQISFSKASKTFPADCQIPLSAFSNFEFPNEKRREGDKERTRNRERGDGEGEPGLCHRSRTDDG
ncbi:hypothetical protein HanPI659440_Chr16g0658401 [Helianthus annuus]|nr:hypothetical protein HanPI659440_Chr16g0658401 [Helianthus annuus]